MLQPEGMLELSSPVWAELDDAYGSGQQIPSLLEQLTVTSDLHDWDSQLWQSLWSRLCHQRDVYTASYAALPHLVAITASRLVPERIVCLALVGSIEAARHHEDSPPIPPALAPAYHAALPQAAELVLECLRLGWSEHDYKVLFGTLAVVRGEPALGSAIFELEHETPCPECGAVIATPGYSEFEPTVLKEEGVQQFIDDEEGYQAWVHAHPLGLVFLLPRNEPPETLLLHRATCPAIQEQQADQARMIRIGVPDLMRLMLWQSLYGFGSKVRHCRVCQPGSAFS